MEHIERIVRLEQQVATLSAQMSRLSTSINDLASTMQRFITVSYAIAALVAGNILLTKEIISLGRLLL